MKQRKKIGIKGIVQGVGFRPFIYTLATKHCLNGFVCNNTRGVVIEVEGEKSSVEEFISNIKQGLPPLSRIDDIKVKSLPPNNYKKFTIKPSSARGSEFVLISPDIATCEECLQKLFDKSDRRFGYPFINCTNCGPRFTIIREIPYDRKRTTMKEFNMCIRCQNEYDDPLNRWFHTQPNGCPECGPEVSLVRIENRNWKEVNNKDPIKKASQLLKEGKIVAIKGLGGFYLACDAKNSETVVRLRERKNREEKPFAIMVKDIQTVKSFCEVNRSEEKLLLSRQRPIVLLRKKKSCLIAGEVAPNQNYLGVMLPYTPLHHLLFSQLSTLNSQLSVLVMTSGNLRNEPITHNEEEAFSKLSETANYFLIHNREIHTRCDDSVIRAFEGREMLVRRARGYVPEPITLPFESEKDILSCGAELKNTFCLTRGNYAFVSQHMGDLENFETFKAFEEGVEHFKHLFSIDPEVVAYDMHPEYLSTKYAQKLSILHPHLLTFSIQHHHAHIASCMAENGLKEKVIGIAFDGTGYGVDGTIWGGEFLVADFENFKRAGHFQYIPMLGGEMAIKEPWRMAVSYLYYVYGDEFLNLPLDSVDKIDRKKWLILKKMLSQGINSPLTSSVGRLFDAVSAILGIRNKINYEGQAAIELEATVKEGNVSCNIKNYKYRIREKDSIFMIDVKEIIIGLVEDLKQSLPISLVSFKFHNTIVEIIVDVACKIKEKFDLNKVVLSGGVFQNMFLLHNTVSRLNSNGCHVYTHHKVPTNDGGISLGQAAIASWLANS